MSLPLPRLNAKKSTYLGRTAVLIPVCFQRVCGGGGSSYRVSRRAVVYVAVGMTHSPPGDPLRLSRRFLAFVANVWACASNYLHSASSRSTPTKKKYTNEGYGSVVFP